MNKIILNILKITITFSLLAFSQSIFSYDKVEDIFLDINKNYTYYNELQSLFDKWMITPDLEWKFNPNKLLTRDEFVWVVMEVWCSKCIKPNTALEYILKYSNKKVFFDVGDNNDYFYCISDAYNKDVVKWYSPSYVCQDWTTSSWETPFCTNNNITLEEAVAVLLRNSSVFTINDNNNIISQIEAWIITTDLAKDLKPKNLDWSVYTFYWYFKKALELDYKEYDIYWNEKKYSLIEIDSNWNINPKKYITKQDFLKIAYIISKINSCSLKNTSDNLNFWLELENFDKECNKSLNNCTRSQLIDKTWTYDFKANIWTFCEKWIKDYTWYFYNQDTKENYLENWEYLDNYKLKSYWNWIIRLIVQDNCGNFSSSQSNIIYKDDKNIWLQIFANPIFWKWPLKVDFRVITSCLNCKYEWNFWDGNNSNLKNPTNTFKEIWIYEVELIMTLENWNKIKSKLVINVIYDYDEIIKNIENLEKNAWDNTELQDELKRLKELIDNNQSNNQLIKQLESLDLIKKIDLSTIDTDWDWVFDDKDKCIYLYWDASNFWCPILDETCLPNSEINTCKSWFFCNTKWFCEVKKDISLIWTCIYPQNWSSVFWNVVCNTCPCDYKFDFLATLRKCDIVIPAIVSPNWNEIYSKWNPYQIPYNYK